MIKNNTQTPKYKPSGIDWLGNIPMGWEINKIAAVFDFRNTKVSDKDFEPLSVTYSGVKKQIENVAKTDNSENRKLVRAGDIVINGRSDRRGAVGISKHDGSVSVVYHVLKSKSNINVKYFHHLFRNSLFSQEFFKWGRGIHDDLWTTRSTEMGHIAVPLPPLEIQKRIADFLDEKTKVIDELVAKKKKLIELLREKRAALITHAVTKGLDPNAKFKTSDIDWLGDIPARWELKRNRFLGSYIKGKTADLCTSDEKDCLSYLSAEVIRGQKEPEFCRGPVVVKEEQILLLWDGANAGEFFWAGPGIVSSTFSLILPRKNILPKFYFWLLKGLEKKLRDYTQGMGIPHVSPWILQDSFLPELPWEEQKRIAVFLNTETEKIDKAVALIESQIEKLKEYRLSLIYHAVTGKIKI